MNSTSTQAFPSGGDSAWDVIVVGAGAGGLTTAIVAKHHGLEVLVIEKAPVFGGTAALSGGVLWVPNNPISKQAGIEDSRQAARTFLQHEAGVHFQPDAVDTFLTAGPEMVEFFQTRTQVRFIPTLYPDYHPDAPGGVDVGRSILAAPFDIRELGADMKRMRPPLRTLTFMGMMFNSSSADLKHFFNVTQSLQSFRYVLKRLTGHLGELLLYSRGVKVTGGNALAARLAKSALDLGIPIWTSCPGSALITDTGRVHGIVALRDGNEVKLTARQAVVLACGGFSHDTVRTGQAYPHLRRGGEHVSPVPVENTGDGARLAESAGGRVILRLQSPAAWMPVSRVPFGGGEFGVFPHLLDRYKPGVIGVLRSGRRFTNESNSYHDVGAAMIEACKDSKETAMWLVCDQRAFNKFGLGYAKPFPVPSGPLIRQGYIQKGATLAELAARAGIDPGELEATVRDYNMGAQRGEDPQFHRGSTSFNRYLADPTQAPNPCVAEIGSGPYYALKLLMGDLGTFDGVATTAAGQVLNDSGLPVDGLYSVGADRASVMGGNYPGAGITLGPIMALGYVTARHIADAAATAPSKERLAAGAI